MEASKTAPRQGETKIGDVFRFVTYVDGKQQELTGTVEVMMPSSKARALGLTKSKRCRLFLGLQVEGHKRLIWKDKGQVRLVRRAKNPGKEATLEEVTVKETKLIMEQVKLDLKEKRDG